MYSDALEEESGEARNQILRRLGDVALFISGVFSRSLKRRVVDVDYYIAMGGGAYLGGLLYDFSGDYLLTFATGAGAGVSNSVGRAPILSMARAYWAAASAWLSLWCMWCLWLGIWAFPASRRPRC